MYTLFDKFLNNRLTREEIEDLRVLLQKKKNKKAFETYLQQQRDPYAILQEIDLQEAVLSARPNWLLSKSELYHMVQKIVMKSSFIILV